MRTIFYATLLAAAFSPALAHAAELQILTSGSTYDAENELGQGFTKQTGNTLVFSQGSTGMMLDKLKSGAPADIVVLSTEAIDALDKEGALLKGSKVAIGSSALGMAIAKGAPKPDISTPEKFRAALFAAKTVLRGDPTRGGTSSIPIDNLLKRPEFAGLKTTFPKKAPTAALAQGEGDVALELVGDILAEKNIQLVGPFPAADNTDVPYAAAIPAKAAHVKEAQAFLKVLTNRDAAIVWKKTGIEATR
jgi:molybdate transport system substrate-binding protein